MTSKVRLYPINLEYELNIWTTRQLDMVDALRRVHFFSSDIEGNGAVVSFDDLDDSLKEGIQNEVLEALQGFSFDLTIGPDVSVEKSDPTSEVGRYYKGTIPIIAHTWWAEGYKIPLIRKIISNIYDENVEPVKILGSVSLET